MFGEVGEVACELCRGLQGLQANRPHFGQTSHKLVHMYKLGVQAGRAVT